MKIGNLEQHCGECDIIDFCGNSFGYCICNQERFKDTDTDPYKQYAEQAKIKQFSICSDCQSEEKCEDCENVDEAKDYYCEKVEEYVETMLQN